MDDVVGRADVSYQIEDFARETNVSRETLERIGVYGDLLVAWQDRFNLVGTKTIPHMWHRHFRDSAQLLPLVEKDRPVWLDFGSGAGFPGLVIALLLLDQGGGEVHLVESITKKCRFLEEVKKEALGGQDRVRVEIHNLRLESLDRFPVDVISARAVTGLAGLLDYAFPFFGDGTVGLFPKGQDVDQELTDASKYWNIDLDKHPSHTDPRGSILRITGLSRTISRETDSEKINKNKPLRNKNKDKPRGSRKRPPRSPR